MALSSWLCASNSKSMFVKIVHPGGRVELHDRPMMAAEIMLQNPRCYVTYPEVFRQPWAVLPPDSVLLLGHKYYVVPAETLRRLQRAHHSSKRSPSPSLSPIINSPNNSLSPLPSPSPSSAEALSGPVHGFRPPHPGEGEDGSNSSCWFFSNKDTSWKKSYNALSKSSDDHLQENDGSCLTFLCPGPKARVLLKEGTSSSTGSEQRQLSSSSETRELVKYVGENVGDEAKKLGSVSINMGHHWQPNLESIREEPPPPCS